MVILSRLTASMASLALSASMLAPVAYAEPSQKPQRVKDLREAEPSSVRNRDSRRNPSVQRNRRHQQEDLGRRGEVLDRAPRPVNRHNQQARHDTRPQDARHGHHQHNSRGHRRQHAETANRRENRHIRRHSYDRGYSQGYRHARHDQHHTRRHHYNYHDRHRHAHHAPRRHYYRSHRPYTYRPYRYHYSQPVRHYRRHYTPRYHIGGHYGYHHNTIIISDYGYWNLYAPPHGYHWVHDHDSGDAVLASIATGAIIGLVIGALAQ